MMHGNAIARIQPREFAVNLPEIEAIYGRQFDGSGVGVERVRFGFYFDGLGNLFKQTARGRLLRDVERLALKPGRGGSDRFRQHERGIVDRLAHDSADNLFHHDRRQFDFAQANDGAAAFAFGLIQFGDGRAVGLGQLAVERVLIVFRQINAGLVRIAGDLAQAARCRLQNEVVARFEPPRQRTREQAGAVPAFRAFVHEQNHAMRRTRIVEPFKGV